MKNEDDLTNITIHGSEADKRSQSLITLAINNYVRSHSGQSHVGLSFTSTFYITVHSLRHFLCQFQLRTLDVVCLPL